MVSENCQGLALEGRNRSCVLKAAGKKKTNMIVLPLEGRWVRMTKKNATVLSVSLKTRFPGTREGDSQIVADETGLCNSIFMLPQHQDTWGQRRILFCELLTSSIRTT